MAAFAGPMVRIRLPPAVSQQTFGSSKEAPVVRSHDRFAVERPVGQKDLIGNPPLPMFVEAVGPAGSLATIMDICGKYRTPVRAREG
jgi:hypothetical protein